MSRLVLLHGMGHDSGQVAGVRALLEARGVVVVTPDLCAETEVGGFDALRAAGEPMADDWAARFPDPAALVRLWRSALTDERRLDPAGIGVPTLVIGWPDDDLHPIELARRTAGEIPGATFVEVPTPGAHNLPARELAAAFFERFTAI